MLKRFFYFNEVAREMDIITVGISIDQLGKRRRQNWLSLAKIQKSVKSMICISVRTVVLHLSLSQCAVTIKFVNV